MKRAALSLSLLVTLLTLLPFTANAQKGWVRMPSWRWGDIQKINFYSNDTGVVESDHPGAKGRQGKTLSKTYNGGNVWFDDGRGEDFEDFACQDKTSESVAFNIFAQSSHDDLGAIFCGYRIGYCEFGQTNAVSRILRFDRLANKWFSANDELYYSKASKLFRSDSNIAVVIEPLYDPEKTSLLLSSDAGVNWKKSSLPDLLDKTSTRSVIATHFQGYDTLLVIASLSSLPLYYRSVDAGKNWSWFDDSLSPISKILLSTIIFNSHDQKWYANSTNANLLISSNAGLTWENAPQPPVLDSVPPGEEYYSYSHGYRIVHPDSLNSVIQFTTDSGITWLAQAEIPEYLTHISAPSEHVAYAVGPNGLLYKTTDGGGRFADVAAKEEKQTKLKAWTNGDEILVENFSGDIQVFDLLGRLIRTSRGEKLDGFAPGMYFVVSGGESVRVLVAP